MECQLLVKKGEPVDGRGCLYSDGIRTWWDVHVPKKAMDEPRWDDYKLTWPLEVYATDFGMSGWDWERLGAPLLKVVGFDLDSIAGGHDGGLTTEQLEEARAALEALPYIEFRRNTRGGGYHAYVHVADIATENHSVHAVLAKAILGKVSTDAANSQPTWTLSARSSLSGQPASDEKRSYRVAQTQQPDVDRGRTARLACRRAATPRSREAGASGRSDDALGEGASDSWDELCSSFTVVKKRFQPQ